MSDLISRQAATDALSEYIHNVDKVMGTGHLTAYDCKDAATSVFEELPSAQPDCSDCVKHGGDWDCDHVHCHKGESAQPGFNEWCTDCKEYDQEKHCCPRYNRVIREALDEVEKREKGKWIVDNVETEHCSVCKHRFYISALFAVGGNDEPPYCPNCGAKMEEEDE